MAALDPRYEHQFDLGPPTNNNLNTAAGNPLTTVTNAHWLYVVSGGTLPASAVNNGRFVVPWCDMHIALLKIHNLDPAMVGTLATTRIVNLRAIHDALQRAVTTYEI